MLGFILVALFSARVSVTVHVSRGPKVQVPSSFTHAPCSVPRALLMHAASVVMLASKLMAAPSFLLASSLHRASVV